MPRSFTDEELKIAVSKSINLSEVCKILSLYKCGASYNVLNRHIVRLNLDTSHWSHEQKREKPFHKTPLEKLLVVNSSYGGSTSHLKDRLLKEGLLEYKCYNCGICEWDGKPLSLQLDHINGDRYDNRLENLRLLCPNCHSQTETYGGKRFNIIENHTCECGLYKSVHSLKCRKCRANEELGKNTKTDWPELDILIKMVEESSYVAVGKQLGVTDNAVKKHIQKRLK